MRLISTLFLFLSFTQTQARVTDSFLWNCEYRGEEALQTIHGMPIDKENIQLFVYRAFNDDLELKESNLTLLYYSPNQLNGDFKRNIVTLKWNTPSGTVIDAFDNDDRNEDVFPEGQWPSTSIRVGWKNLAQFNDLQISLDREGSVTCNNNRGITKRRYGTASLGVDGQSFPLVCVQSGTFRENLVPSQCEDK